MDNFEDRSRSVLSKVEDRFTEIRIEYKAMPEDGMLFWLEEEQVKKCWQLDDARIEPEVGGLFYLRWVDKKSGSTHVVYGAIEKLDIEKNHFKVAKAICIFGDVKVQGLSISFTFSPILHSKSLLIIKLEHTFPVDLKPYFQNILQRSFPLRLLRFQKLIALQ